MTWPSFKCGQSSIPPRKKIAKIKQVAGSKDKCRNLTVGSFLYHVPYMSSANNIVQFMIISLAVSNMTALCPQDISRPGPCYLFTRFVCWMWWDDDSSAQHSPPHSLTTSFLKIPVPQILIAIWYYFRYFKSVCFFLEFRFDFRAAVSIYVEHALGSRWLGQIEGLLRVQSASWKANTNICATVTR